MRTLLGVLVALGETVLVALAVPIVILMIGAPMALVVRLVLGLVQAL